MLIKLYAFLVCNRRVYGVSELIKCYFLENKEISTLLLKLQLISCFIKYWIRLVKV